MSVEVDGAPVIAVDLGLDEVLTCTGGILTYRPGLVVTREYLRRVAALLEPRYRKCEPCGMWRPNGRQVGPPRRHADSCTYVETCNLLGVEPELV